jgi:hypothetical protein
LDAYSDFEKEFEGHVSATDVPPGQYNDSPKDNEHGMQCTLPSDIWGEVNLKPGLHPQKDSPNDLTLLGPHGSEYLHFTGTHDEPLTYDIVSIAQNVAPLNTHKCVAFNLTNTFTSLRL